MRPEPLARIGLVTDKIFAIAYVLVGGATIAAAVVLVVRGSLSGSSVPLGAMVPPLRDVNWGAFRPAMLWLLSTPQWIWLAAGGLLVLRIGLVNLREQDRNDPPL